MNRSVGTALNPGRRLVYLIVVAAALAGLIWAVSGLGGVDQNGATAGSAAREGHAGSAAAIPDGEPAGPLVSVPTADAEAGFDIVSAPAQDLPQGYAFDGTWVAPDQSHVRLHFAGPEGDIVLIEMPSDESPREPNGLEFPTSVGGHPALGVKGDVPPDPTGPVSQLIWWADGMYFDLYGPVSYAEIEAMATSVASSSASGASTVPG
jgi:hypothetical protein